MIAQPIVTTPSTQQQASQTQPASTNGFLALLSPDNSTLFNMSQSASNAAPSGSSTPANSSKSASTDNSGNPTPYLNAPVQTTIVPTAVANQGPAAADASDPAAAIAQAAANPFGVNGNGVPSNPVLPASNPQTSDAGQAANATSGAAGTSNGSGNSTDFGADVNARVAAGAPIYASQPNASMATVPPHLLNAPTTPTQSGDPLKPSADGGTKSGTEAGSEPVQPASAANPAAPAIALHTAHAAAADQSQNGNGGTQDGNAGSAAANSDTSSTAANTGDAAAGSSLAAQSNAPISTPAQLDAAVHTAAPYVPVGEQVALSVKQALTASNNEIRIQLKPASLGTIDVKLNLTQDGRVSAVISADRSDTLNMLKQDSGTLQQSLRDAGLNADGNSLSFNLRGDAQSFAQNSSQGGFSRGGNGGNAYSTSTGDALVGADATISSQRYHTGSLDIEV